ncbi:chitinase-like protein PB1E7.04c isoform X2 [Quillaja saponaria]|uniref:Chitinase-like protein PB1E7.04c isoform X2 n=1 Tax=Quillaja saponaria TaxID=32244 RepID=A0AAD7Q8X1_QUISA|nr:chitinase-like protein PB1E7.04c isoform X2 [Quillaja saponaria]
MDGYEREIDVRVRRLSLIDVSSEDDSLIVSPSGNVIDHQFSENQEHIELLDDLNANKSEDTAGNLEEREQVQQLTETFEIDRTKINSKYNLRKSLAWDSAFFTSAGVLEPEELSSMIECVEKGKKHVLPRIQEDVHRSCESISTLESDSLTLESLEVDLFEDVRASIQKSSNMSNAANGSSNVLSLVTDIPSGNSSNEVDSASQDKMKSKPTSKNPSAIIQGSGKMTKKNSISSQVSQKSVPASGESPLLKQPKLFGKSSLSSTGSTKRASLGDLHVKAGNDNAKRVTGRVSCVSKTPLGSSRMPKPTQLSKTSSGSSAATRTKSTTSSESGSTSSDNVGKSPSHSLKRKVDAVKGNRPSSSSGLSTPRKKTGSGNSGLAACLKTVNTLSCSTSPASSISELSSESLPSTLKQKSNSSITGLDSSSCRKVPLDFDANQVSDSENFGDDQCFEANEAQVTGIHGEGVKNASAGTVLLPAPVKPSGLRLPSPKIGFFDGAKPMMRTPRGGVQPHVPGHLAKVRVGNISPGGGENKGNVGKLQPVRSVMATKNLKPDNQQTALTMKPKYSTPRQGLPKAATRTCSMSRNVNSCTSIPTEVQSNMPLETVHWRAENMNEGHNVVVHDPDLGSALNDEILNVSIDKSSTELKGGMQLQDVRTNPADGEHKKGVSSPASNIEVAFTSSIVKEASTYGQLPLKAENTVPEGHGIGIHDNFVSSARNGTLDNSMDTVRPKIKGSMNSMDTIATPTDREHNTRVVSSTYSFENASSSQEAKEGSIYGQCKSSSDLNPINDNTNNPENSDYEDQVDALSREIEVLDMGMETHTEVNGDSVPPSQPNLSFEDDSDAMELSSYNKLPGCRQKEEGLNDLSTPTLSLSPTTFDVPTCRRPFTTKDSLCNMDSWLKVSTESTGVEVKTSTLPLPEIMKENK